MFFKDVGVQNACRFVACLIFFNSGDVVKDETHHHRTTSASLFDLHRHDGAYYSLLLCAGLVLPVGF